MTLRTIARVEKSAIIDGIRRVLQDALFPRTTQAQREAVLDYLAWLRDNKEPLNTNCQVTAMPELRMMRITFELSSADIPPIKLS